jgi:ParB-like nuclease domain
MARVPTKRSKAKGPKERKAAAEAASPSAHDLGEAARELPRETVFLDALRPHPENYKRHPEDQLRHIEASLRQNGVYRDVVVARDNTILAGHGVVQAARNIGLAAIRVVRLDVDPASPRALKVLALDNELPKFAEGDDRALAEILRRILVEDSAALLGTGFDQQNLAALLMVTRPTSEIRDMSAAAEWVGMPEYEEGKEQLKLVITFKTEADRKELVEKMGLRIDQAGVKVRTWSTRYPFTEREDAASVRFETGDSASGE